MALFTLKSMSDTCCVENPEADYRQAKKVAQYRVSGQAAYFPAFPGNRYVPFGAVTRAISKNSGLPIKGTCGKAVPVVKVRLYYDGEYYQEFLVETLRQANQILDALEGARPDVPIDREKRKFEVF